MSKNYQQREYQLKRIIKNQINVTNNTDKIKFNIFYRNKKLMDLILTRKRSEISTAETSHVVYQFNCPNDGCKAIDTTYIGFTTCTLQRRSYYHYVNGAIRIHFEKEHKMRPT